MFDTRAERERALGFGFPLDNFPYPDGELDASDRAYIWGSFLSSFPPNQYYIENHVERALALLIEEFKRREYIVDVVSIFAGRAQEVENAMSDLLVFRSIDTAYDATLDIIGEIVGQGRGGRTDVEFRAAIRARIQINASSGTPDQMSTALQFFTNASQVRLIESFPGAVRMFFDGTSVPDSLTAQMQAVAPAAVRVTSISYITSGIPFEFASEGGIPYGEGDGFSETNYLEGGQPIGGEFCELAP